MAFSAALDPDRTTELTITATDWTYRPANKYAGTQRPLFGRRVRPYSPRPRSSPHCPRRALSRTLTAFWPASCARLERTAGPGHQRVGRQNPGPPAHPALRRVPGVRARLILGAYSPVPTVPPASGAGEGSPVTSEGSWPFRCLGHHGGAGDGGVDDGIELVCPASTLLHFG